MTAQDTREEPKAYESTSGITSNLTTTLVESVRYRGLEGQWAFLFHRISGLAVLLFLFVHILDTSTVFFIPSLYEHAINIYRSTPFMLGEIALVAAVIYHGLNGYKIIYFDEKPERWGPEIQARWFWGICIASFLLWLPAAYLMGKALYLHNICQCPPVQETEFAIPLWANLAVALLLIVALAYVARRITLRLPPSTADRSFETKAWLFMRWSGVLLVPLVWIHVLINDVLVGAHRIDLDFVAFRWASLGWRFYAFSLLALAFTHGVNGLRYVVDDFIKIPSRSRVVRRVLLLVWVLLLVIGATAIIGGVGQAAGG